MTEKSSIVIYSSGDLRLPPKGTRLPNGKTVVYSESHRSSATSTSRDEAERRLCDIRECHPEASGWVEVGYQIYKQGDWFGVERFHYQAR